MLVASVLCLALQSQVQYVSAKLSFNIFKGEVFIPDPMTVNADSILEIEMLKSSKYPTYSAGDCFRIEFDPIDEY